MSVEEYRIAQLYMIAKKSREESTGAESGVEILINEPYTDGPGGKGGQYTHKLYHVGSHLPAWVKSFIPKSALIVEEEAWNAYPYAKTRWKCPLVEKLLLECETYYTPDGGHQENIFNLTDSEKRNRIVDIIDIVKDNEGMAYDDPEKEDPTVYISKKTGRGPLNDGWLKEHWTDCDGEKQPTENDGAVMCAYKLFKVEFRYWGLQSRVESMIHDIALRKTMLNGHLRAWTWQDEWHGLTMEDIRVIERQTAVELKHRMQVLNGEVPVDGYYEEGINGDLCTASLGNNNAVATDVTGGTCIETIDTTSSDVEGTADKTGLSSRTTDIDRYQ